MQFELTKDLHGLIGEKLVLGAVMFEADGQLIMFEYYLAVPESMTRTY